MPYSYVNYSGDGVTTTYSVTFPYLSKTHVQVRLNGVLTTAYTWPTSSSIQFTVAPANGVVIEIRRVTNRNSREVDFVDASVFTEENLDNADLQNFYIAQEVIDDSSDKMTLSSNTWDAQNKKIVNLSNGTLPTDAATLGQLQPIADAASASASAASTSATNAASSASAASTSATNAANSASAAAASANAADASADTASDLVGSFNPTGCMMVFAANSPPTGWLLCQGQAVSRTTYAALFSVIGTTYGSGDGSTTFNIPDARGRVIIGVDGSANRITSASTGGANADTLGGTGGAETHTLTTPEMPAHTHSVRSGCGTNSGGSVANTGTGSLGGNTSSTGGGEAHSNTQPWLAMNFIIKY